MRPAAENEIRGQTAFFAPRRCRHTNTCDGEKGVCPRNSFSGSSQGLFDRQLKQGVLLAALGDRAAVTVPALVIAAAERDRAETERLLALHRALAAAVALLF